MSNGILRARIADAEEILELQRLAYRSEAVLYDDWSIPPLVETLEEVRGCFAEATFLKACLADRIIGSVRVSAATGGCAIGRLIVHPDFQGRGVGTQLLLAVEAEFPAAKRFELFTGSKSERNIRLYERLGYRIFSRKRLSELVDVVYLEKRRE